MATTMRVPEGEELAALVRALAALHGIPCDDGEFPDTVAAFRQMMLSAQALDAVDWPESLEPAPVYHAAVPS